jgi:hypothetical protein
MSAPALWIGVPLIIGAMGLLLFSERAAALAGGLTCLILSSMALVIPIDEAFLLGPLSVKVGSTASLLGRSLVLPAQEGPLLALVFGLCALWFFGAEAAGVAGDWCRSD